MKYLPLIRAGFRRRPLNAVLTFVSVTSTVLLIGLVGGFAAFLPKGGGNGPALLVSGVVALGIALILFLTGNAVAQTVRARMGEFAVLKALGFSTRLILGLVLMETAAACIAGALAGLLLAEALAGPFLSLFSHGLRPSRPFVPLLLYPTTIIAALVLAAISTAVPGARVARLDAAAALRGGL